MRRHWRVILGRNFIFDQKDLVIVRKDNFRLHKLESSLNPPTTSPIWLHLYWPKIKSSIPLKPPTNSRPSHHLPLNSKVIGCLLQRLLCQQLKKKKRKLKTVRNPSSKVQQHRKPFSIQTCFTARNSDVSKKDCLISMTNYAHQLFHKRCKNGICLP